MITTKLLYPEPSLQVLPTLACRIGVNEAMVLQQLHYWLLVIAKATDDEYRKRHFFKGKYWRYGTYQAWKEQDFPFWSETTIKRTIHSLEKQGLLESGNFNEESFDKTKWYTINYEAIPELVLPVTYASGQIDPIDEPKLTSSQTPHEPTPAVAPTRVENGPETTSTETTSTTNINTTYCLSDESSNTAKTSDDNTSKTRGPEAGESVRPNSKSGCDNNIEDCNRNLSKKNKETVEWADKRCVFADFAMPDLLKEYRVQIANGGDKRKLNAIILVALEKLGITTTSAEGKPLWAVASKLRGVGDDKTIAILSAMYQKAQEGKLTNPNGYMHAAIRASPKQVVKEGKVPKITSEELEKRREEMGWA